MHPHGAFLIIGNIMKSKNAESQTLTLSIFYFIFYIKIYFIKNNAVKINSMIFSFFVRPAIRLITV